MGNYGASYFNKSDDDAANDWMRIAALSKQVGDEAEKTDTAAAYESLVGGKGIPEGMSDTVRINAKKMLKENLEGETVAAEQNIMADLAAKSKEQGVGINDYLRNNVESYLTTPASYRAVGNISKMFQERQLADANYQKAKIEEGVLRYKEVSSLVEAADGLYKKGDMDGATKMIEQMSRIMPMPGFAKKDEKTGEIEFYSTDLQNGGHNPTGVKLNVRGAIDAAKSITRDEFALGFAMNSQAIKEITRDNVKNAMKMKDKDGGRYMGYVMIDPYDATDTKFIVRQEGTGKPVAQFASIHEATDSGFTPYDQKYEEGERKIKYMDEDQVMQRSEHGARMQGMSADMMMKNLSYTEKEETMAHNRKKWAFEELLYPTKEEYEKEKLEKLSGRNDKEYNENLDKTFKALGESGIDATPEISSLARELPKDMTSAERANAVRSIATKTSAITDPSERKKVYEEMVAASHGLDPAVYAIKKQNPNIGIDELSKLVKSKAAESKKQIENDNNAKAQAEGMKAAESVFSDIAANYERRKMADASGSLVDVYTGKTVTDDDLWKAAAQDPLFGKGLYDVRESWFKNKTPDEMLEMAKQWYAQKKAKEMARSQAREIARTQAAVDNNNRQSFYKYGR